MKKKKLDKIISDAIKAHEAEKKKLKDAAKIIVEEWEIEVSNDNINFFENNDLLYGNNNCVESQFVNLILKFHKHALTTDKQTYKGLKKAIKKIVFQ